MAPENKAIHRTIGFKIIAFYILLSLITLSFVISIIFENQVEIIGKNTMLETEKQISQLIGALKKFNIEAGKGSLFKLKAGESGLQPLIKTIEPYSGDFLIFDEKKEIIHKSSRDTTLPETGIEDGLRAMTISAFSGKDYYLRIDEKQKTMNFYIPLNELYPGNAILLIKKDISILNNSLSNLYKQVTYVIIAVVFFHILFAGFLYRTFILPLKKLGDAAQKFSGGDTTVRVQLNGKNLEFDLLAEAFNNMAGTAHDNISSLSSEMEDIKTMNRRRGQTATRDALTGLLNINYIGERITEELKLAESGDRAFSLAIIDIDDFNKINALYGKQTGDIILMETAKKIASSCSTNEIPARTGGEEFSILYPRTDKSDLAEKAEKIRKTIADNMIVTPDGNLSVTVSIGVFTSDSNNRDMADSKDKIIKSALSALSEAKSKGKNRIQFNI
ncbi:MAG TPA: diguanylate cyclase [Spirochaetota bacterium]|nr:diguanylate cyclase [Spirochaetota bacterium]